MLAGAAQLQPESTTAEVLFVLASMCMYVMVWVALAKLLRNRSDVGWWVAVPMAWAGTLIIWFVVALITVGLNIPALMIPVVLGGGVWALFATRSKFEKISMADAVSVPETAHSPAKLVEVLSVAPAQDTVSAPVQASIESSAYTKRSVSDLTCLVQGMMADGMFVQAEADYLFLWLRDKREHLDQPPFNAIYRKLDEALADGVLDEDEAADISELFQRLVLNESDVLTYIDQPTPKLAKAKAPPQIQVKPKPKPKLKLEPKPEPKTKRAKSGRRGNVIDHILISYVDSIGFETEREVTVYSLDGYYLKGFCHLRDEFRTFRIDNIVGDVMRIETGELLSPEDWRQEVWI